MTKQEFETLLGKNVSAGEYHTIELVYAYHPAISEVKGKEQVVKLYKTMGIGVFEAMTSVAADWMRKEQKMAELRNVIERATKQYKELEAERQELIKKWKL